MKREPFGDRVRTLREKKKLGQNELAEKADLAPAVLSRILSPENREPRIEHVLAIARVLNVTVAELVGGTTADGVVEAWIPRERYDLSESDRIAAKNALDVARAESKARESEVEALRTSVDAQAQRLESLEDEATKHRADLEAAREQKTELTVLRKQVATLTADRDKQTTLAAQYLAGWQATEKQRIVYTGAFENAKQQFVTVQKDLVSARNNNVGTAAIAALLAGCFVAVATSDDSPPPRKRR